MIVHAARLGAVVVVLIACSREQPTRYARHMAAVPPQIVTLASDALTVAAEIKVSGDVDAVLREHALAPRYAPVMMKHFELMRELHRVGLQSRIRYPRSSVSVRHDQFCQRGDVANLVVAAMVRYDMESIPPNSGSPGYTAGLEEHVFRFEHRAGGLWVMVSHREITLAEMHQRGVAMRLRNPCGPR